MCWETRDGNSKQSMIPISFSTESPPAWMQEAYCPPRSKCSLCRWGGGYPIQSWWGVPHAVMVGGYSIQSWWGVPHPVIVVGGTPSSHGGGVPWVPSTIYTWLGVPHPVMVGGTWGPPTIQTWLGYPPHPDLAGVPPTPDLAGRVPPTPDPGWGTPPASVDRHTDSCQNVTFPCT